MTVAAENPDRVSPLLTAGLLLAATESSRRLDLPHATVDAILAATDATRSRAYELRDALLEHLPSLQRASGRPRAPQAPDPDVDALAATTTLRMLRFVMARPGCVRSPEEGRATYTDAFRQKVVELCVENEHLPRMRFADAVLVPLDTLEDWMRPDRAESVPQERSSNEQATESNRGGAPEVVVAEWKNWHGSFGDFCTHLNEHCRIAFKRTLIGNILRARGARTPEQRGGRSRDERALRGAFETFFPNAQWVGDGTKLSVHLCGQTFDFNLELMVDPYSGGFVGAAVGDTEDGKAVTDAWSDAKRTTNGAALALLLDNKPSNHTPDVDDAIDGALRIRATVARAQNKAHVEGGFGLFKQSVPEMRVDGDNLRGIARSIVSLVVMTYFRAVNRRPRADRNGRSRVEIHGESPTPEQIAQARSALAERCRRQDLARRTLQARQQPAIRKLLDEAFAELALLDPERSVRVATGAYPLSAIVDGIATFKAKRAAGTLPEGADARYLLGIVRNIAQQDELDQLREELLRERIKAHDKALADLLLERQRIAGTARDLVTELNELIDHAMDTQRQIDRMYWLLAVVDLVRAQQANKHVELARTVTRRVNTAFRITPDERKASIRFLIDRIVPLS